MGPFTNVSLEYFRIFWKELNFIFRMFKDKYMIFDIWFNFGSHNSNITTNRKKTLYNVDEFVCLAEWPGLRYNVHLLNILKNRNKYAVWLTCFPSRDSKMTFPMPENFRIVFKSFCLFIEWGILLKPDNPQAQKLSTSCPFKLQVFHPAGSQFRRAHLV